MKSRQGSTISRAATGDSRAAKFTLRSSAFADGAEIPVVFTADGADRSPPLAWESAPEATREFALIVNDPDAPSGNWIHWVLYRVPGEQRDLPQGVPGHEVVDGIGTQGLNDFGSVGWGGPSPPRGRSHRYRFRLLALDAPLALRPRLSAAELLEAIRGHVLAETILTGNYQRVSGR